MPWKPECLSTKRYSFGDGADLVPLDVAFGWGPMSDNAGAAAHTDVSQAGRWYHLRWQQAPIPEAQIMGHSGNMHLIPANSYVEDKLHSLARGAGGGAAAASWWMPRRDDGWSWKTSLRRDDVGGGSCELFFC